MTHKPTRTPLALLVLLSALGACAGEASNVLHEERTKRTQPSAQPGPTLKTMGALGYSGSDAGASSPPVDASDPPSGLDEPAPPGPRPRDPVGETLDRRQ